MSEVRNWLATLWGASYKGVNFWFSRHGSEGGRDKVIHKFPHRDTPFIEDMGEEPRFYEGEAYVHGDDADAAASALEDMLVTQGVGTLVMPTRGPIQVEALHFKRNEDKDKLGYIAFTVKFVRAGASFALISIPLAGQLVFNAADAAASALAALFSTQVLTVGRPDFVVDAAVSGVQTVLSAVDVARQSWQIDPVSSAILRDAVAATIDATPLLLSRSSPAASDVSSLAAALSKIIDSPASDGPTLIAQAVTATIRKLGNAAPPISAQAMLAEFADAFPAEPLIAAAPSANSALARQNEVAADQLGRLSALIAWAEALARRDYASRPDGVTARAEASDRFEAELNTCPGAEYAGLYVAVENVRGRVVDYLSRLIADLAPVIEIVAPQTMPSLYWSFRLYADADHALELAQRNNVRHPSFMPDTFKALAPR